MTTCYLVNITPFAALNSDTPYAKWHGRCANYSILKTFGCAAFSHQNEGKLKLRARKCVFLGYPKRVKGYRLWDRSQKEVRIIVSRDVTFNEYDMPCLKLDNEKQQKEEKEKPQEESSKLSIHIPTTLSEMENQSQPLLDEERETIVDEHFIDQPPLTNYQLARDREKRPRRLPQRLEDFDVAYASYQKLVDNEPNTYEETIRSKYSKEWVEVMKEEMSCLSKNQTWELVSKPKDKSIVGCK